MTHAVGQHADQHGALCVRAEAVQQNADELTGGTAAGPGPG